MIDIIIDIRNERKRQDEKWGQQDHPHGTSYQYVGLADEYRIQANHNAQTNDLTWADILQEEVYEALASEDIPLLREELIQVCAVALAWIESIDRKEIK